MNVVDILLILLIAAVMALAVYHIAKTRKKCGMCSGCDQAGNCRKKNGS